jgi:hypothetical protein
LRPAALTNSSGAQGMRNQWHCGQHLPGQWKATASRTGQTWTRDFRRAFPPSGASVEKDTLASLYFGRLCAAANRQLFVNGMLLEAAREVEKVEPRMPSGEAQRPATCLPGQQGRPSLFPPRTSLLARWTHSLSRQAFIQRAQPLQ